MQLLHCIDSWPLIHDLSTEGRRNLANIVRRTSGDSGGPNAHAASGHVSTALTSRAAASPWPLPSSHPYRALIDPYRAPFPPFHIPPAFPYAFFASSSPHKKSRVTCLPPVADLWSRVHSTVSCGSLGNNPLGRPIVAAALSILWPCISWMSRTGRTSGTSRTFGTSGSPSQARSKARRPRSSAVRL